MDTFQRDGLEFDVRDTGPRNGGVVVLLHGFPQDSSAWDAVTPALHEAGLRTLAPDQRGYSPKARPPWRSAYRSGEGAADVVALLDAAEVGRAHVVGHDWGGAAAWATAGFHRDRVASLTVLSAPHPAALLYSFTHSAQALRSWPMGLFQLPVLPELLARRTLRAALLRSGLPAEYADRYVERMGGPGALTGALNWYRGIPASLRTPVPSSPVPTTYAWGRRDCTLGRAAAEATARHALGTYRFVELDAGHWLPETRPREVAALVLDRVRSTA